MLGSALLSALLTFFFVGSLNAVIQLKTKTLGKDYPNTKLVKENYEKLLAARNDSIAKLELLHDTVIGLLINKVEFELDIA